MSTHKAERLVNLVICLLSTRQFLSAARIRKSVAGYEDCATDSAFSRMFERDKAELRDLGIPLETGRSSAFDIEDGYRINRDAYELPDVDLSADEAAAVAVAIELWESPEMAAVAHGALMKLRAAGVQVDPEHVLTRVAKTAPRTRGSDVTLRRLLDAIEDGRAVQFDHRSSRGAPFARRTVEPWGVVTHQGRWYLVGYDRDRQATRTFRLSRITGAVSAIGPKGAVHRPEGSSPRELVAAAVSSADGAVGSARVWVNADRGHDLRRAAESAEPMALDGDDGDLLVVPLSSTEWLARAIAGHGPDAAVLEPEELRADVLARLENAAGGVR